MANENEIVNENAEIAALFVKLEKYAKDKPDVFAFFCKKYEQILYDNFDWAFALFHGLDVEKGIIEKFMPYIGIALNLIILIFMFIKLK